MGKSMIQARQIAEENQALRTDEQLKRILAEALKEHSLKEHRTITPTQLEGVFLEGIARWCRRGFHLVLDEDGELVGIARSFDRAQDSHLSFVEGETRYADELIAAIRSGEAITMGDEESNKLITFERPKAQKKQFAWGSVRTKEGWEKLLDPRKIVELVNAGNTVIVEYGRGKFAEFKPYLDQLDSRISESCYFLDLLENKNWHDLEEVGRKIITSDDPEEKLMIMSLTRDPRLAEVG